MRAFLRLYGRCLHTLESEEMREAAHTLIRHAGLGPRPARTAEIKPVQSVCAPGRVP